MRTIPLLAVLLLAGTARPQGAALGDLARIEPGRSRRISSAHPDALSNWDNKRVKAGQTYVLADIKGAGRITHIWMTFAEPGPSWLSRAGAANHSELVLRMFWDGAEEPAVEAPVGDFFASGFGERVPVHSAPVVVEGGDAYNCYWQMPYYSSARIAIENQSAKDLVCLYYHVDYLELDELAPGTPYFCAQYNQAFPEKLGQDHVIADITGRGHYVGTVLSVRSRTPAWFGEGDEKFFVDGETAPSIWGTGTEDYFLCAWGLEPCSTPYFGCTLMDGPVDGLGTRICLYRWHLHDPVRFKSALRLQIEHNGWIAADETEEGRSDSHFEREDDIATVAFWYQVGQPRRFAKLPPAAERVLPELDRVIEASALRASLRRSPGELVIQKGHPFTGEGQLFFKAEGPGAFLEFDFAVPEGSPRALFLRLTRSYDYGRYRILLDGKQVVAALDLYSKNTLVRDQVLQPLRVAPGAHVIRLECLGQHPESAAHWLGLDSVRLRARWDKQRPNLHDLMKKRREG